MSWVSQLIILRHLLDGGVEERPLWEVAETLGYTAMAVTHGVRELERFGFCRKIPQGRAKTIHFDLEPVALWKSTLVSMRSPAGKRYPVAAIKGHIASTLDAGLTALSGKTNLAYNGPRILAVPNRELRPLFSDNILETRFDEEDADLTLEGWYYRPQLLSNGPAVDELSLYLSLKNDPDERVQMALTELMERRAW